MSYGFDIDPYTVLGVTPGASLKAVRLAFHEKSKKHHPDHGGDEWAFRVVVRSYEILSEAGGAPASALAGARADAPEHVQVRPGVRDRLTDPAKVVAVEMLWLRYEVGDILELVGTGRPDSNLSGSLSVMWPDPDQADALIPADSSQTAETLGRLVQVFDEVREQTPVTSARAESDLDGGKFTCWLYYGSGGEAWRAFKVLHQALRRRGLGVRQWTRDLLVPREE